LPADPIAVRSIIRIRSRGFDVRYVWLLLELSDCNHVCDALTG
jgi:hypothetical protein